MNIRYFFKILLLLFLVATTLNMCYEYFLIKPNITLLNNIDSLTQMNSQLLQNNNYLTIKTQILKDNPVLLLSYARLNLGVIAKGENFVILNK